VSDASTSLPRVACEAARRRFAAPQPPIDRQRVTKRLDNAGADRVLMQCDQQIVTSPHPFDQSSLCAAPAMSAPSVASGASSATQPADPDRVWFYLDSSSQQRGPVTPLDIADLLLDRDINSRTYGSVQRAR
jgi:hypothetical protein